MGENTRHSLDEFTFGGDGLFFDPIGQPCVLIGTVEFQNFCHVLDESFDTPLGRRLIYAATDGEERSLHDQKLFQFGRWFGRRRVERRAVREVLAVGAQRQRRARLHLVPVRCHKIRAIALTTAVST